MAYFSNPVPEGGFDRRYLDQELRAISDGIQRITGVLELIESTRVESAVISQATAFTGGQLTSYTNGHKPNPPVVSGLPQLIVFDELLGTITVGYDGIYSVSGYVTSVEAGNGVSHAWAIDASGTQFVIGAYTTSNQANGYVMSAQTDAYLTAGTVLSLQSIDIAVEAIIDITGSVLDVKLRTFDVFV